MAKKVDKDCPKCGRDLQGKPYCEPCERVRKEQGDVDFYERVLTPKGGTCPKCKSLLDDSGNCSLCKRVARLPTKVRQAYAKEDLSEHPEAWQEDIRKAKQPKGTFPQQVPFFVKGGVVPVGTDQDLVERLRKARRMILPIIRKGQDPAMENDYIDLRETATDGGVFDAEYYNFLLMVTTAWLDMWKSRRADGDFLLDHISPEVETRIFEQVRNSRGGIDVDEYVDAVREYVAEQGEKGGARQEVNLAASTGRTEKLPVRIPTGQGRQRKVRGSGETEEVKWHGVQQLQYRDVRCPRCFYTNKDPGTYFDRKLGKNVPLDKLECVQCHANFKISTLPEYTGRMVPEMQPYWDAKGVMHERYAKVPEKFVGPWRPAHKGDGPEKRRLSFSELDTKLVKEVREAQTAEKAKKHEALSKTQRQEQNKKLYRWK